MAGDRSNPWRPVRSITRYTVIVAGSLLYWLYAPLTPLSLRELLFPECYAASNPRSCDWGGSAVQLIGFVAIGLLYSLLLWRALRLSR